MLVEDILVQFVAVAVACLVVYQRVVVDVLLLVANGKTADVRFGTVALERHVYVVASEAVGEGYVAVVEAAVSLLTHI